MTITKLADKCEVGPKLASGQENEEQVLVKFFGTPDEYAWIECKCLFCLILFLLLFPYILTLTSKTHQKILTQIN
jgi:hypothetical protein